MGDYGAYRLNFALHARAAAPGGPQAIGSAANDCLYGAKDNPVRSSAQLEAQPNRVVCEAQPHAMVVAS